MPRPRVLPNIILGLLGKYQTMSGKDMITVFNTDIKEFWSVSHSQLYPELQRMVEEKQIRVVEDASITDHKIIKYEITKKGRSTLKTWLSEPITAKNDELTALKLFCIDSSDDPALEIILKQELDVHENKLKHLNSRLSMLFADDDCVQKNYGHYLILTSAIGRETKYIAWMQDQID